MYEYTIFFILISSYKSLNSSYTLNSRMETRKLQRSLNKFPLFLPKRDLELLGWCKGDDIKIDTKIDEGKIVLTKVDVDE